MNETCPECHGRQLVYDEPCPTCHGSRSWTLEPHHPGPDPRRRQGRPADPAEGQGRGGRERRPAGDLFVTVHVAAAPALRTQGRQPDPRGPGRLRRGGARRRDQGPHARRRPGDPEASRRARRTAGSSGSAAAARRARTARKATCSSPSRSRCPTRSTRPPARPSRPTATHGAAPTRAPHCSRVVRDARPRDGRRTGRAGPVPGPDRAGLRDQRRRRAHRPAPADAAPVRPRSAWSRRAAPAAAAGATPCATSSCCARSPS